MTYNKLVDISNDVTSKFLNKQASLNEAICDAAVANKLTPDEVQRVVEYSNTKAYLQLVKTAENKYVDFEVADTDKILKQAKINSPEKEDSNMDIIQTARHSDYDRPPTKQASIEKVASKKVFEKTAKLFYSMEVPSFQKEYQCSTNIVGEHVQKFDERVNKLSNHVRQLLMEGSADMDAIKTLVLSVDRSGLIWESIKSKLEDEFPIIKKASVLSNKVVDSNTNLYKQVSDLEKIASEILDRSVVFGALAVAFQKEAGLFIEKIKTPAKVIGAMGLLGTAYVLGQKSQNTNQNLREFEQFKRTGGK